VRLVKAEDSDLLVPADAETVMEGVVLPKVRELEAPYGEYTGYYGTVGMRPVVEVRKITQRKNPIYYSITAKSSEVGYYFLAKTIRTLEQIQAIVPSVKTANFLTTFVFVICLKKLREGEEGDIWRSRSMASRSASRWTTTSIPRTRPRSGGRSPRAAIRRRGRS
jgi:UbiD family decarboxylase